MVGIGERISVIASFGRDSGIRPLRFIWSGRRIVIREVTYKWITKKGDRRIIYFSVTDGNTLYELSFDTVSTVWKIEEVEAGV